MNRQERLKHLAGNFHKAKLEEQEAKNTKEKLRGDFATLATDEVEDHQLPVKHFTVPDEFFKSTGMTMEEFTEKRFPGWYVEHVERDISSGETTFVFKRQPNVMPVDVVVQIDEDHDLIVSKSTSEYTPEVDWASMEKEDPDLYGRLAKKVETIELDEEALAELVNENPGIMPKIHRHLVVKAPVVKVSSKVVKRNNA